MAYTDKALRSGRLELRSIPRGTKHLIALAGELDLNGCPKVEAELIRAESNGAQQIVLDLSGLEFIDSTGIALLVAAMRRSKADSNRLRFVPSHSQDVQRLLHICGLDGHLPLVEEETSND
jgi:anti-sigma B factor antagonist